MTERLVVFVESDLKRRLERIATREDRSLSNLMRQAIKRILSDDAGTPDPDRGKRTADATRTLADNYAGKV